MKKVFSSLLFITLLFCLGACAAAPAKSDKLNVVCTIFPPYDFVREIGGDSVDVKMLLSPGSESHSYEPTMADLNAIHNCDLFIYIGSESDEWVEDMLSAAGDEKTVALKMTDCVTLLEEAELEGMEEEHHHEEPEMDEHVWTSLRNSQKIVSAICDAMCKLDEKNAESYRANAECYIEKLDTLDRQIAETVQSSSDKTLVFSERFPFRYFAEDYGLHCYAAFSGCSVNDDASLATVAFLIGKVREYNLPYVFYLEFSKQKIADTIVEATGAEKRLFHSCHNVSQEDFDKGVTYFDLMSANAELLKEAFACR